MKISLKIKWGMRLKLHARGNKLHAQGDALWARGDTLRAKGAVLWAKGAVLWARGDTLRARGDALWAEAVLTVKGNIKIKWTGEDSRDCELETGEYFRGAALKDVADLV